MTTYLGKAIHSVKCASLSWAFVKFCVCHFFPLGNEGGKCDMIALIPEYCLSIYVGWYRHSS